MRPRHLFLGTLLAHACFFVDVTDAAQSLASLIPADAPMVGEWLHEFANDSPTRLAAEPHESVQAPR